MGKIYKKSSWDKAVALMATQPDMDLVSIAKECDISMRTLNSWRQNGEFGEAMYNKYMSTIGVHMPGVVHAMIREAKLGNVQAARFVGDISGKLVRRVSVVNSPGEIIENWLSKSNIEDAEILKIEDEIELVEELPPRDIINSKPKSRSRQENKKIKTAVKKGLKREITPEQRAKNRKKSLDSYRRLKRAKKVGLEPLGRRKGEARRLWYAELEKREKEMGIK